LRYKQTKGVKNKTKKGDYTILIFQIILVLIFEITCKLRHYFFHILNFYEDVGVMKLIEI